MLKRGIIVGSLAVVLAGCATVTVTKNESRRITRSPDYSDSKSFFFWGLVGRHEVDVAYVCRGNPAEQLQTQMTFVDGLLTGITWGLYAPRTAKVWCAR
jgi:hypothetical protein